MTAAELARELEVSPRTVLRDVVALSSAGIPVYAERGRDGGFALLPGFTTDLTGLTHEEVLALLTAQSQATPDALGLGPAFAAAVRKVVAAMPEAALWTATDAADRVLVRQEWHGARAPEVQPARLQPTAVTVPRRTRTSVRVAAHGARGRRPSRRTSARGRPRPVGGDDPDPPTGTACWFSATTGRTRTARGPARRASGGRPARRGRARRRTRRRAPRPAPPAQPPARRHGGLDRTPGPHLGTDRRIRLADVEEVAVDAGDRPGCGRP